MRIDPAPSVELLVGFNSNVLFIVGAGASRPYGFPTGTELVDGYFRSPRLHDLAKPYAKLQGVSAEDIAAQLQSLQQVLGAAATPSIDEFLRDHPEYGDVARFAIAYWLLEMEERAVRERTDRELDWIAWLFDHAYQRSAKAVSDNIRFVTFNYDRLIELSFQSLLVARHGWQLADAVRTVGQMPVVHVYGSLKASPRDGEPPYLPVPLVGPHAALDAAKGIRLMGDTRSEEFASTARKHLAWAQTIVAIGFGYHRDNVEVFRRPHGEELTGGPMKKAVHYGGFGMLLAEQEAVQSRCRPLFGFGQIGHIHEYWSEREEQIRPFLRRTARFVD